ncbi:MAG: DUF58 domain-containing protein [Kiritimatiellae bacterium]|jgi:uncharacterized protein (DUF58 family)|nr:DUF58 domain-containing protein [Kiritimatiellia bacterium]
MLETPSYMKLLPTETVSTLGRLEFLAKGVMEGTISGRHRSPHKGSSVEFAEHRQYVPGDDLRNLDWRVLGRTDKYYIRQYDDETNLRATLMVDASGSMNYRGEQSAELDGKKLSKFEYAQHLAAALTYLLIHQQDAVGLVTFDSKLRRYMPAKGKPSQIRLILQELENTEPGGDTSIPDIFHDIAERIHARGVVVIISDLFDSAEEIIKALHHFKYRKHEVIVLHIMAEEELTFPFNSFTRFKDLEDSEVALPIDPKTLKAMYLDKVSSFLSTLENDCGKLKIEYIPISTAKPYDAALAEYLTARRM